jgi:pyrimidine operon attenuation protein/uracil phosphoribosyltransferase
MNPKKNNLKSIHSAQEVNEFINDLALKVIDDFQDDIDHEELILMGIETRGVTLAHRIRDIIYEKTHKKLTVGSLGITLYRDDIDQQQEAHFIKPTELHFPLDDLPVILIDDVLFSGRTIRAALNEIMDYGRPRLIRLLVLIDRCCRQLPIHADYCAKQVTTPLAGKILIRLKENDPELGDGIFIEPAL